jgi:hypothetical protein
MKMEEYVPTMLPMVMTKAKLKRTGPPSIKIEKTTTKTVREVITVLGRVELIASLKSSSAPLGKFP